jgi:hypothetical protein
MNKRRNLEVYYDDRNYASWVLEKTVNVLKDLCRLVLNVDGEQKLLCENAIQDALKLYSFWMGDLEIYSPENYRLLSENGIDGFDKLNNMVMGKPDISKKYIDIFKNIKALLTAEHNNRTLLYGLLNNFRKNYPVIENMKNDIEKVTMGEETWAWFCDKYESSELNLDK